MHWLIVVFFLMGLTLIFATTLNSIPNSAQAVWYDGTPPPSSTLQATPLVGDVPTYYGDVEPIIEAKCLGCHQAGQIGYARYPMDTPQDIIDYAEDVAYVVGTKYMPPWMPSPHSLAFQDDRRLSQDEINTIVSWWENGATWGDEATRQDDEFTYTAPTVPSLRSDLVLTMPEFVPDDRELDGYRCFLLDPQFTENTFITGYHLVPGAPEIVHHIILYQAAPRIRAEAMAKDGADGQPGWDCYGGTTLSGGGGFASNIGDWGPGTFPRPHPAGTGVAVSKGTLLILQIHYNLEAGTQPDQTQVILQLAQPDETIYPLQMLPLLTPVEIPCPSGMEHEACSREYAIEHADSGIAEWVYWRCRKSPEDYAGQTADHAWSSCDYTVPADAVVVRVAGHMHALGTSINITLSPESADSLTLLDIPTWDFHWQGDYALMEPLVVKRGTTIRLTCSWDNSEGDRYIVWGERTQDEMCLGRIQYVAITDDFDLEAFLAINQGD